MEDKTETASDIANLSMDLDPLWLPYVDLFIHPMFFRQGLLIVSTGSHRNTISRDTFFLNGREYSISSIAHSPKNTLLKKTSTLLTNFLSHASQQSDTIKMTQGTSNFLFNKFRREEIFLPIDIMQGSEHTGLYVYPWIDGPMENRSFEGFSLFVTAGCMFGPGIKAMRNGQPVDFINHQLKLASDQRIESIEYQPEKSKPFETLLFHEFENHCLMIGALAKSAEPKKLVYHLPTYDYILFALKFYLRGQMTFDALDTFILALNQKKMEYHTTLSTISAKHGIDIQFVSPFEPLFPNTDLSLGAQPILDHLHLESRVEEQAFVEYCKIHLKQQSNVWRHLIEAQTEGGSDLDSLLKIGNASVIAQAAEGKKNHDVCSMLPLSEKQIQIAYNIHQKKCPRFPKIVNLTFFEKVITYSPQTQGLLFYFSCCLTTLNALIGNKNIAQIASKNISLLARNAEPKIEESINLNTVLEDKEPYATYASQHTNLERPPSEPKIEDIDGFDDVPQFGFHK